MEIQQWESRDPELSGTSKIFKIGPIAKKLQHFKVGQISDTIVKFWIFEKCWKSRFFENRRNHDFSKIEEITFFEKYDYIFLKIRKF